MAERRSKETSPEIEVKRPDPSKRFDTDTCNRGWLDQSEKKCDTLIPPSTQRPKQFVEIEKESECLMRTRPSVVEKDNKTVEPIKKLVDKPSVFEDEEEGEKLEYKPEMPSDIVKLDSKRETEQTKRSKFNIFARKKPSIDSLSEKSESFSTKSPIFKKLKKFRLTRRKSNEDQQADKNKSKHDGKKAIKHNYDNKDNDRLEFKDETAKLSESRQSLNWQLSKLSSSIRSHFPKGRRLSSQQSNDESKKSTKPTEKANEEKWCGDEECRKQNDLSSESQQENEQQMNIFDNFEDQDQFGSPEDLLSQSSWLSSEREENDEEKDTAEEMSTEVKAKLDTTKSVFGIEKRHELENYFTDKVRDRKSIEKSNIQEENKSVNTRRNEQEREVEKFIEPVNEESGISRSRLRLYRGFRWQKPPDFFDFLNDDGDENEFAGKQEMKASENVRSDEKATNIERKEEVLFIENLIVGRTEEDRLLLSPQPNPFYDELKSFRKESLRPTNKKLWEEVEETRKKERSRQVEKNFLFPTFFKSNSTISSDEDCLTSLQACQEKVERKYHKKSTSFQPKVTLSSKKSYSHGQLLDLAETSKCLAHSQTTNLPNLDSYFYVEMQFMNYRNRISSPSSFYSAISEINSSSANRSSSGRKGSSGKRGSGGEDLHYKAQVERTPRKDKSESTTEFEAIEVRCAYESHLEKTVGTAQLNRVQLAFAQQLEDFVRLDKNCLDVAYADDIGQHYIDETRIKLSAKCSHPDRDYFEQWRTRFFDEMPIGQLVVDRLIRMLDQGVDVKSYFKSIENKIPKQIDSAESLCEAVRMILNQALRVLNEFREGKTRQFRSLTYQIETGPNNKEQLSSYDEIIINQNIDLMKTSEKSENCVFKEFCSANAAKESIENSNNQKEMQHQDWSKKAEFDFFVKNYFSHSPVQVQLTLTTEEYLVAALLSLQTCILLDISNEHFDVSVCVDRVLDKLKLSLETAKSMAHRVVLLVSLTRASSSSHLPTGLISFTGCYWNQFTCLQVYHNYAHNGLDWIANIFYIP